MRKLYFIFIFAFGLTLHAQTNQMGWVAKFGAAGGFQSFYVMPELNGMNSLAKQFGLKNPAENGVVTWGGGGYAYVMIVPNLRMGGVGFGGQSSEKGLVNGLQREIDYSFGAGAFTLEYSLPFIKNIAVSIGAMIGGGTATIELHQNDGIIDWKEVWNEFDSPNNFTSHKMENTFFTFAPTLNVDIPLTRFVAFRVGGGYILALGKDWTADNGIDIVNVPNNLNSNSFFIQTGLYFGFFAF